MYYVKVQIVYQIKYFVKSITIFIYLALQLWSFQYFAECIKVIKFELKNFNKDKMYNYTIPMELVIMCSYNYHTFDNKFYPQGKQHLISGSYKNNFQNSTRLLHVLFVKCHNVAKKCHNVNKKMSCYDTLSL